MIPLDTDPPPGATVLGRDERGPVRPRTFPPAPAWSADGHRITAPLDDSRGPEKLWDSAARRVRDGQAVTLTAPWRHTAGDRRLLEAVDVATPIGALSLISDNLSRHQSAPIQAWLAAHPHVPQVCIPPGACWLHRHEGWWRRFRRAALARQTVAADEIDRATRVARPQVNQCATPWVWGRPPRLRAMTVSASSPTVEERGTSPVGQ